MAETLVSTIHDPGLTARGAADAFAQSHFDWPRRVGVMVGQRFQLQEGRYWYRAKGVTNGWEIWRIEEEVT